MRMRLPELQDDDKEAMKLRSEGLPEGWEDIEQVLHYQDLPYVPKVIRSELISRQHDDPLAGHFGIEKTQELIARKSYWPTLRRDNRAGTLLLGPSIHPQSYPLRADKQASQRPSSRRLWHREDPRPDSQKVLLTNATTGRRGLYQGM